MNRTLMRSPSGPRLASALLQSSSVVGHTSGTMREAERHRQRPPLKLLGGQPLAVRRGEREQGLKGNLPA